MPVWKTMRGTSCETLAVLMAMTYADTHALPYAFSGYGKLDNALVHNHPSDLDLFLMLALGEYLAVTGDMAFLDQKVPFYPASGPQPNALTVLDHARTAFDHLIHGVGIGDNGLIRVGDGDLEGHAGLEPTVALAVAVWVVRTRPGHVEDADGRAVGNEPDVHVAVFERTVTKTRSGRFDS